MDMEVKFSLDQSFNSNDSNSIIDLSECLSTEPIACTKFSTNHQVETFEKVLKCTNEFNYESDENENKNDNVNSNDESEQQSNEKHSSTFSNMMKKHIQSDNKNQSSIEFDLSDPVHSLNKASILKSSTTNDIETIINTLLNQNESLRINQSANSSSSSTSSETNRIKSFKDKENFNQNSLVSMSNLIDEHKLLNKNLSKKGPKSKKPWYSVFTNSYKQKNEDFRRLFKLPPEEHLLVDYSCALQREILAHGRLYVSSNHVCFRANIIGWETSVILKLKDIRSLVKDKTAKIIPNAITIVLDNEKYFLTSFGSRDKTYTTLIKVWQNALSDGSMTFDEISGILKGCYGEDLGYNSEDVEYEYYSKLKIRPSSDNLDLAEGFEKQLLSAAFASPIILGTKNLDNIDEKSFSDDQANISMKKELSESSSSSSFGRLSTKIISQTYQPGHRHSSSYDASITEMNNSAERPRSMVVEKSSQIITNRPKTSSIASPVSLSSFEPAIESIHKSNESTDMNNNESKIDFTQNNISAFSPISNSSTSSSKKIELSSSMIGQTSMFSSSPITSSPSESNDLKNQELNNNSKCSCTEHLGKELMNQVFDMSVNQLFECLFGHSEFCQKYWESRKFINLTVTEWKPDHVLPARRLEYIVDLGGTLRPRNTEDQKVLEYRSDVCIVLESQSVTHGVPYADSFIVFNRFCMTRISSNQSRVVAHAHIHYRKKANFIVKSFIERNSTSAIRDSFLFLEKNLPEYQNLPEKKPHISAITSEISRKSLTREELKLSSEELDTKPEPRNRNSVKRTMKKRHGHSNTENHTETPGSAHHHHHSNSFHHTTPHLERSLSNQTQLVPIQKFSFFRWEVNVDTLVRLFIVAMMCLMVINGMLYYKLRRIESLADSLKTDPSILAKLSNPSRQFERALLNTGSEDSGSWQSIISNTLEAISKMEGSLKQLEQNFKNRDQLKDDL